MRPDLTLCPVTLARDLHGLDRMGRIAVLRLYVSRITRALVAGPADTDRSIAASGSVLYLYAEIDAA